MVRFCRGGGEAMAIAVRIARAASGKDIVAFCGYHGWHDWYLAANLNGEKLDGHLLPGLKPKGVPLVLKGTAFPFHYNKIEELEQIVEQCGDRLGVIVIETIRDQQPKDGFLKRIREIANKTRSVLVCDEVSSGFRLNCGGAHLLFGLNPDIAVFAKAISNGYPMGAIIGIKPVMDIAQETFISSTYWTERIGPAAALATITKYQQCKVNEHLIKIGNFFQSGMKRIATETGVKIEIGGISPLSHFKFTGKDDLAMMTLYVQEMLNMGFLASRRFYSSYSHKKEHMDVYLYAAKKVFQFLKTLEEKSNYTDFLKGLVASVGFSRLA
jgi:glutamate-1-semialdehyde aminotransferase